MRWRRTVIGISWAAGALAFGACATPGYDPPRIQSELVDAGATPAQARCVTDNLGDTFDLNQLGSHSDPNAVTSTPESTSTTSAPTSSPTATAVSTSSSAPGSTTSTTLADEYELTRQILKKCGVTLPLQPR